MLDAKRAVQILDQGRAVLDPIAGVAVVDGIVKVDSRHVDVPADNAVAMQRLSIF
jgi:F0F1-type ATP synthase epsilon subunit